MGHTSGLCNGMLVIALGILVGALIYPPLAFDMARTAIRTKHKYWALFFSALFLLQVSLPIIGAYYVLS